MKTPFEKCKELKHKRTRFSPNGIEIIEECETCDRKWIMPTVFNPNEKPITIYPVLKLKN